MTATARPRLAVWKFASCDGCQLTLLDCQDELLALAAQVEIAHFTEANKTDLEGPYDVSLVEGSVTTPEDAERIQRVRAQSRTLVTIGESSTRCRADDMVRIGRSQRCCGSPANRQQPGRMVVMTMCRKAAPQ